MKNRLFAGSLFLFASGTGFILSQFHPYTFAGEKKNAEKQSGTELLFDDKKPLSETFSELINVQDAAFESSFERVLCLLKEHSHKNVTRFIRMEMFFQNQKKSTVYTMAEMEMLVRRFPNETVHSLKSAQFLNEPDHVRFVYAHLFFFALAKFYPDSFYAVFTYLNADECFPYNTGVIEIFFDTLAFYNPEKAYAMIQSENMSGLEAISGMDSARWMYLIDKARRKAVQERGEVSDAFFEELKNTKRGHWRDELYTGLHRVGKEGFWKMKERIDTFLDTNEDETISKELRGALLTAAIRLEFESADIRVLLDQIGEDAVLFQTRWGGDFPRKYPDLALDMIEKHLTGEEREKALVSVLKELGKQKSSREMATVVESLSEGLCKMEMLPHVFFDYYKDFPSEAVDWMLKNEGFFNKHGFAYWALRQHGYEFSTKAGQDLFVRILMSKESNLYIVEKLSAHAVFNEKVTDVLQMMKRLEGDSLTHFATKFYGSYYVDRLKEEDYNLLVESFYQSGLAEQNPELRKTFEEKMKAYENRTRN